MANQTTKPDPIDIADERGKIAPGQLPEDDAMAPGNGIDEVGIDESSSDAPPIPNKGTPGTALGDLADPDADANFPDPSKPISMNAGPQPARGRNGRVADAAVRERPPARQPAPPPTKRVS